MNENTNNIPSGAKIAKNASFLTTAYIFQKLFAFVYFTLIARWIGPEDVGKYVFAISITTILSIFIDLGMGPILIRETAKFKEKTNHYLNTILSAKIIFSVLAYLAVIIIIQLLHKDPLTTTMVYISGLVMILDSFTLSFWGVFRGHQNLRYESISIVINQIFILIVGLGGIMLHFPIWVLVLALLAGSTWSFFFSAILARIKLHYSFKFKIDKKTLSMLLKLAIPFALAGIFTRVYSYIDQVLLSILIGDTQLGWYSVPYKITFALQFVPSAFAASIYPAMSNYYHYAQDKLAALFERSMYFLMIIAIPISIGTIMISNDIILTLYKDAYVNSILPLIILIVALPAIFLAFPVGAMLNSCNKQHINTINLGVTMIINIVMNVILIPKFQHVGASIAASISLYYLFISNLLFVKTIITYNRRYLWLMFMRSLFSSAIMGAVVYYINTQTSFIIAIVVGIIVYGISMWLVRGVNKDEIIFIRKLLKR